MDRDFAIPALVAGVILLAAAWFAETRAETKRGSWAGEAPHVLEWLNNQKQPGSETSCCGIGDAVNVKIVGEAPGGIRLVVTNGRGNAPDGMELVAPLGSRVSVNMDPDGEAVAWVSKTGTVFCLSVPPKV